jgi:hypothetical protein
MNIVLNGPDSVENHARSIHTCAKYGMFFLENLKLVENQKIVNQELDPSYLGG